MHRLYEHNDVAVFWDSDKCRYAAECKKRSPMTFDPVRRPWIDLTKAPAEEIWDAVSACPSGALTIAHTHEIRVEMEEDNNRSAAYAGDRMIGECNYNITPSGWVIYHTGVDQEHGGKGIAKRLVYKVVEAAEKSGGKVIPSCSYAAKVLSE